jgi:Asp-tRNA(Asn)/Glu-tRNA(Gln) amidotransferase C subunit
MYFIHMNKIHFCYIFNHLVIINMSLRFAPPTARQQQTNRLSIRPQDVGYQSDSGSESDSEDPKDIKKIELERIRRKLSQVQEHDQETYEELLHVDQQYQQLRQQHAFLSDQHQVLLHNYHELMTQYQRVNQQLIDDDLYWRRKYEELVQRQRQYDDSEDESL